jgi:hypothetical protein
VENEPTLEWLQELRRETTVLRHRFRQEPLTSRSDVIRHVHDEENCELCALLNAVEAMVEV